MVSESIVRYDDVLALANRLTPLEKIKLVKRMADALEHEPALTEDVLPTTTFANGQTWGTQVLALLDGYNSDDWQAIEMPDVVAWVKQRRVEQDKQRGISWGSEEWQ